MTATVIRPLLVVALSGLVPGMVWLSSSASRPPVALATSVPLPVATSAKSGPLGTAGCAAAACHGSSVSLATAPDLDCWKGSAVRWLAGDPHANAYSALTSPVGQRIMDGLRKADPQLPASAAEYDRCLACHTNPTLAAPGAFGLAAADLARVRADGVGCEACHGNAGPWLAAHTAVSASYPPAGMADLNNVGERAKACAGCHIGAPADPARGVAVARDMNHDMIAAGHPRLTFELTEFQRQLPPHWFERERTTPGRPPRRPGWEATAWLVGRVAVAEAACELTADRTGRAWPEFAEANCFACHHKLVPESWRQRPVGSYAVRPPGALPWQSVWPVTHPDEFDSAVPGSTAAADAVRAVVGTFNQKHPPTAAAMRTPARAAAEKLAALRKELSRPGAVVSVEPVFQAVGRPGGLLDWDEAGQVYFGLAAVARSLGPPFDPGFAAVRGQLVLKPGSDSPDNYSPEYVRSGLAGLTAGVRKKADAGPGPGPK